MKLKIHPACALLPEMPPEDFEELRVDIGKHGQKVPIVVIGDEILDGRHRYRACEELGIEPVVTDYQPSANQTPTQWVLSTNLYRRHLDEDQRIAVAMEAFPLISEEKKMRQKCGQGGILLGQNSGQAKFEAEKSLGANSTQGSEPTQTHGGTLLGANSTQAKSEAGKSLEPKPAERAEPTQTHGETLLEPKPAQAKSEAGKSLEPKPAQAVRAPQTREELAAAANTSRYKAEQAIKLQKAAPEKLKEVAQGKTKLKDALKAATKAPAPTEPRREMWDMDRALNSFNRHVDKQLRDCPATHLPKFRESLKATLEEACRK